MPKGAATTPELAAAVSGSKFRLSSTKLTTQQQIKVMKITAFTWFRIFRLFFGFLYHAKNGAGGSVEILLVLFEVDATKSPY